MSAVSQRTWKIVKSHVPLIRFRKGQPLRNHVEHTPASKLISASMAKSLPISNPTQASSKPTTNSQQSRSHDLEISNMRRTIAKRLLQSKRQIPHSYMSIDSDITQLIQLRQQMNRGNANHKVSLNDFIIKIAAVTLRQIPQINACWNEQTQSVEILPTVDISLAVAIPDGLITPIVKNANSLSVPSISKTVKDLATRAKQGKLELNEFQGGSFSISNLGMFGIDQFSAVINPPQAAILAIGRTRREFISSSKYILGHSVADSVEDELDNLKIANLMNVTLSYDSRACDQQDVANFLSTFKVFVEDPSIVVG